MTVVAVCQLRLAVGDLDGNRAAAASAVAEAVASGAGLIVLPELCDSGYVFASRAEALRSLGNRVPDDRLKTFLTLVIQSDQLGAGLGNTLRVFAEEMRRSRFIEAEHKAAELPVKIAVPLVFFIFPCLMGIIFTPIIIRFIRILFQVGV